jgi:hypothetical protein
MSAWTFPPHLVPIPGLIRFPASSDDAATVSFQRDPRSVRVALPSPVHSRARCDFTLFGSFP